MTDLLFNDWLTVNDFGATQKRHRGTGGACLPVSQKWAIFSKKDGIKLDGKNYVKIPPCFQIFYLCYNQGSIGLRVLHVYALKWG